MRKTHDVWEIVRSRWARYEAYRRAYSNSPAWPLVLRLRQKLFRGIAAECCQYLAQGTVLDIGTGGGSLPLILAKIAPNARVIGIDIEQALLHDARKNVLTNPSCNRALFLVASADALPFLNRSFDVVVSIASLHLWHDRQKGIAESYRVLRRGGIALMLVDRQRIYPGKIPLLDLVTRRSAKYLRSAFEIAGFTDTEIAESGSDWLRVVARK